MYYKIYIGGTVHLKRKPNNAAGAKRNEKKLLQAFTNTKWLHSHKFSNFNFYKVFLQVLFSSNASCLSLILQIQDFN